MNRNTGTSSLSNFSTLKKRKKTQYAELIKPICGSFFRLHTPCWSYCNSVEFRTKTVCQRSMSLFFSTLTQVNQVISFTFFQNFTVFCIHFTVSQSASITIVFAAKKSPTTCTGLKHSEIPKRLVETRTKTHGSYSHTEKTFAELMTEESVCRKVVSGKKLRKLSTTEVIRSVSKQCGIFITTEVSFRTVREFFLHKLLAHRTY